MGQSMENPENAAPPAPGRAIRIRKARDRDAARTLAIWRTAVDATHHFLDPAGRIEIDEAVQAFLPNAPLILAVDEADEALGFMMVEGSKLEALFIDPACHGCGIGRALVREALGAGSTLTVDVNEMNGLARGFYQRLGFVETGRSPFDDEGRPYPLIHMRLSGPLL